MGDVALPRLFETLGHLKPKLNVVGIVPSSENLPDGDANKPGDIVTSMSGQTIEILNTDAEGRLILCDALTYSRRFKPDTVIDVATLTGACVIALGHHRTAVMSLSDELADEIVAAGVSAEDRGWQMPLADEYGEQLKSNFADFANVGGRDGGAITAPWWCSRSTHRSRRRCSSGISRRSPSTRSKATSRTRRRSPRRRRRTPTAR